jgi:hypothetical protein
VGKLIVRTFRETRTQQTRDLLDESVGGDKGIVFAGKLLDQLLVLVEFLEIVGGHGVDAVVLGSVDVMLVTEDAGNKSSQLSGENTVWESRTKQSSQVSAHEATSRFRRNACLAGDHSSSSRSGARRSRGSSASFR